MYNNISFITGIIQGHHNNNFNPWAYGKYINCFFNSGFGFHLGRSGDVWREHREYIQIINRRFGIIPQSKKVAHMNWLLNEGYYIMIVLDEQYIPGMAAYQKRCYLHDSLLLGYNDEKLTYTLFGRFADGKLHIADIAYSDIEKAVSKGSWSFVLKYEPCCSSNIDTSLIMTELSHYLFSSPSLRRGKETKYGIEGIMSLGQYLSKQYRETRYMDYRYTRGLMEQKRLMSSMCQYLNSIGYTLPDEVLKLSQSASDSASIIHALTLKAKVKPDYDDSIRKRLVNHFAKIVDTENEYIPLLLNCLHNQKASHQHINSNSSLTPNSSFQ